MAAIRGDQILPTQLARIPAIDILHGDADSALVLAQINDLRALNDRGAGFPCAVAKDRLEARLVEKQAAAGADRFNPLVQVPNDVRQFAARQAIHRDDGALRHEVPRRSLPHAALDSDGTEHFQRAHVEECRARQRRTFPQALDGHRRNTLVREECRGRQADQPAARDQYGNFICHLGSLLRLFILGQLKFLARTRHRNSASTQAEATGKHQIPNSPAREQRRD